MKQTATPPGWWARRGLPAAFLLLLAWAGMGCHAFRQDRPGSPAAIEAFAARDRVITRGAATVLQATFTGTGSVAGVGPIVSGRPLRISPTENTTYTLTVTGPGGAALTRQTEVEVVDAVPAPEILADPIQVPGPATRIAQALDPEGLSYQWSLSGPGTILAGETTGILYYRIEGPGPLTLTCVAINAAGLASAPSSTQIQVPAPAPPSAVITAPAQVTAGAAGLTASVPDQPGSAYAWKIQGGTVTGGAGTRALTFSAGAAGTLTLTVTVTGAEGTAATGRAPIQVQPPPGAPGLQAPPYVTARQPGCSASVVLQPGCTCAWTLDDAGLITGGANAATVTFTAGDPGTLQLTCVQTDGDGVASPPGQASIQVVPAPAQPVLAAPGLARVGQEFSVTTASQALASYAWAATNATFTGDGPAVTVTPSAPGPVTLTCTVTNAAGSASAPGTASLAAVADGTVLAVPPQVTTGLPCTATLQPAPADPVQWTLGNASLDAGDGTGTLTFTPAAPGPVTLAWTLAEGTSGQLAIQALAAPAIASFKPGADRITLGESATLAWSASGPGLILPGNTPVPASGTLTVRPLVTTPYILRVVNAAGAALEASATVTVLPAPVIRSFTAARPFIGKGTAATLRADFNPGPGGTAQVDPGALAVTAGTDLVTGPVTATTDFRLTVTNAAGTAATRAVRVRPGTLLLRAGTPSGEGTVDGPAASARFELPVAVAVDPASGTIYVADREAHTVRAVAADGTVTTLAGDPLAPGSADGTGAQAHFLSPSALAWDPKRGLLWVADREAQTLRQVTPAGAVTTWAGTAEVRGSADGPRAGATFNDPEALAVGPDGTVYLADAGNHLIRMLTPGDQVATLAGSGHPGDPEARDSQDGQGASAHFPAPTALDVGPDGTVYVADPLDHTIRMITPDGVATTLVGVSGHLGIQLGPLPGGLCWPRSVKIDPATGDLYLSVPDAILQVHFD